MNKQVPKLENVKEEAKFWEETGLEQLASDQYEEIKVRRPHRPLSATFAVRLDQQTVEQLRQVARAQGLGATQLVRAWVLERLGIERAAGSLTKPTSAFPADFELSLRKKILDTLMASIPSAVEEAMQHVLERADQETEGLSSDKRSDRE